MTKRNLKFEPTPLDDLGVESVALAGGGHGVALVCRGGAVRLSQNEALGLVIRLWLAGEAAAMLRDGEARDTRPGGQGDRLKIEYYAAPDGTPCVELTIAGVAVFRLAAAAAARLAARVFVATEAARREKTRPWPDADITPALLEMLARWIDSVRTASGGPGGAATLH